jgi:SAM-dependent methyltransferase
MFKLYEHVGKKEYDSPEQLKAIMQEVLEGKRLLELGCGPGFGLDVFKRLGAKVTGIEIRHGYDGRIPGLDIRYGNAVELDELCKDDQFDIAYSQDFFADVCISENTAKKVVKALYNRTVDSGYGFHLITYERLHPMMTEFMLWLEGLQRVENPDTFQKWWDGLDANEKEEHGWTNKCSLDPQYLARVGFKVTEYGIEDGDLIIVTERPLQA